MNCKNCGKKMSNGARFCIHCGAEHDTNGQLIIKKNKVDYNKTVMASDIYSNQNNNEKIDYNKTVMANTNSQNKAFDYNKTMMANNVLPKNSNQNINTNNKHIKTKKSKKTNKILLLIVTVIFIFAIVIAIVKSLKKTQLKVIETVPMETTTEIIVETTVKNEVTDYDSSSGYWTKDAESYYENGTMQKNRWVGDYYLGSDGKKVKNKLINDTYYVDESGKKVKNEWYKFTKNIGGTNVVVWYYLGEDGAKLRDTITPDGYYVDADGIYIPGKYELPNFENYIPNTK